MATQTVANAQPFNRWHRSLDDGGLILAREDGNKVTEWIELDISELPHRPELLERLGPKTRQRLMLAKVWSAKDGNARASADMKAHAVLTPYHVTRRRRVMQEAGE